MKINMKKSVEVDAKILKIHVKCCDMFSAELTDQDGDVIHEQEDGYVPEFMPGDHSGDYVILDIDIDTGMILNWKKPTAKAIQEFIAS